MSDLTHRQHIFVEAYLTYWNATRAAETAGYAKAGRQGHRLLKKVEIQEAIKARLKEAAMGADEVLARLTEQGRASIGDFIDENGDVDWKAVKARGHLVKKAGITHSKWGDTEIVELHDAQRAQELLARHYGLLTGSGEDDGNARPPVICEVVVNLTHEAPQPLES